MCSEKWWRHKMGVTGRCRGMELAKELKTAYKPRSDYEYEVALWPFVNHGKNNIGMRPTISGTPYRVIKQMGAAYTATHRCYYLENTPANLHKIFDAFKNKAWIDISRLPALHTKAEMKAQPSKRTSFALHANHKTELEKFENYLKARRLANSTIKTYQNMAYVFLAYFNSVEIEKIDDEMVKEFLAKEVKSRGYSSAYQKQMISAIKLFYLERLNHQLMVEKLPNVKSERKLPKVLSMGEVKNIIEATPNIKHKTLLSLCYACGLRISEALNLKLENVNSQRMVIEILNAKGGKDRIVPIGTSLLEELRTYYKCAKPQIFLFEGAKKGVIAPLLALFNGFLWVNSSIFRSIVLAYICSIRCIYAIHESF